MMNKILIMLSWLFCVYSTYVHSQTQILDFEFEGVKLNGLLNLPEDSKPKGIVLIVHGSGRTNAVAQSWQEDVRLTLVNAGYGTYMWDKMGCGKSGGTFNYNQTVSNSADEAIAAIHSLRSNQVPGSEKIALWGISRASWIIPIIINRFEGIQFWISVSGLDDKENFNYLFENNLRIGGVPQDSIDLLLEELVAGTRITHAGGDYESYLAKTSNLWKNKFWLRFSNNAPSEAGYYDFQAFFMKEKLDEDTGLQIYVSDFDSMLNRISCPVLALFGETDMNVDWQKTKTLYERTLATHTQLTIQSFPNCNHNLFQCETGGFYEFQDHKLPWIRCEGFLESMTEWLKKLE